MKKTLKKIVVSFMLTLMLVPTFVMMPKVKAGAMSYDSAKAILIDKLNSSKPDIKVMLLELSDWAKKYQTDIITAINIEYLNSINEFLLENDFEGLIDATIDLFETDSEVQNELIELKETHLDTIEKLFALDEAFSDFVEYYKSDITIDDAVLFIDKALVLADRYIDGFKGLIEEVNANLPIGFYDIFLEMYSEEIVAQIENFNSILETLEQAFMNRVVRMLNDNAITPDNKVLAHTKYLNSIKNYRDKGTKYYDKLITAFDSESFTYIADQLKTLYLNVVEYDMSYITKLLIDTLSVNDLNESLTDEEISEYVEMVYGVIVNDDVIYNSDSRTLSTDLLTINNNNITNFLDSKFGDIRLTNLAGDKIKTGTIVEVVENGQVKNSYVLVVKGDTLGRGIVDISNIIHIVDVVLGSESLSDIYSLASDLNNDDNLDITDIIRLIDKILG